MLLCSFLYVLRTTPTGVTHTHTHTHTRPNTHHLPPMTRLSDRRRTTRSLLALATSHSRSAGKQTIYGRTDLSAFSQLEMRCCGRTSELPASRWCPRGHARRRELLSENSRNTASFKNVLIPDLLKSPCLECRLSAFCTKNGVAAFRACSCTQARPYTARAGFHTTRDYASHSYT